MIKWLLLPFLAFFINTSQAEPLPAAEVFKLDINKVDPNTFAVNWHIKSGYFLYSDRIQLLPQKDSNIHIGTLRLPPTEIKKGKQGHIYTVYRNQLSIPVSVLGNTPGESLINLKYQGCSDEGFCYPPETQEIKISINDHLAIESVNIEEPSTVNSPNSIALKKDEISQVFSDHNWAMILLIFFGFGLLLSFTPCILPMVPVLSGIIVGHGKSITTKKAFLLSFSYVISMSVTYAAVGAVVALLGANLQVNMQSPWAISIFSFIFILLALSMFGFYEFKLPHSWQEKISGASTSQRGGHYIGAAIMGCLSTLILSPCVTAPLIGVLTYIAQSHNVLLGSLTLFVLSLGMGTPLLLIGTSAGKWLPKSGNWMNTIKAFFGVVLIGIAIYLMARILPMGLTMTLWACLLIFSGIYAGALTHAVTHKEKFHQGVGIILLIYGLLILIGASMGSHNPLQPLALLKNAEAEEVSSEAPKLETLSSVDTSIREAKGRPVMIDFYADWCASCKIIEATTLKDSRIKALLTDFKIIKVDITANTAENKELMNYFRVIAPPTFIFFNGNTEPVDGLRLVGEQSTDEFLKILKQVDQSS